MGVHFFLWTIPPIPWPPILIGIGIGLVLYKIADLVIAEKEKKFDEKDYCHVKFESGAMGTTVTSEGTCKTGHCNLYSRSKGSETRWKSTEKDQPEDTKLEYRCFCHDPNRNQ